MKLIKESWDEKEFEFEDEESFEDVSSIEDQGNPIESSIILADDSTIANLESETESPVEVKTITTTSVEVLDNFTDVREEMARDIYTQFKEGKLSVLDLNKRLAALCGSYEAGMNWLADHEDSKTEVIEVQDDIELKDVFKPGDFAEFGKDVNLEDHDVDVEIGETEVVESLNESVKTLQKLAESSPEAKIAINHILKMLKEDINLDETEIEVETPKSEDKNEFTPEELAKEEKEIEETPNPPRAGLDTTVANELNRMIVGELNTITDYNNLIEMLVANNTSTEIINVIKDINSEEVEHCGQLQQCLKQVSPNAINFDAGQLEGAKQIASPVNVGDPSVDGDTPSENDIKKNTLLDPAEAKADRGEVNKI